MKSFEFDVLDETSQCERQTKPRPGDTQTLRFVRCDVCGMPIFFEEHEMPSAICSACDVKMTTTVVDLLTRGHRIPNKWRKRGG